jgi:signal transduction histidine kinase
MKRRLMIALALCALTPTIVLAALTVRRARADLEREVVRGNLALIRSIGRELDGVLQSARHTLEVAAAAWAEAPCPSSARSEDDSSGPKASPRPVAPGCDPRRTRRILARVRNEAPIVEAVDAFLLDDPRAEHIERQGSYGGYVSEVEFENSRPRTRVIVQARGRTGELVGYLEARLDLGFVATQLGGTRLGPGAELLVVDGFGRVVAGRLKPGTPLRGQPAVDAVLASPTEGSLREGENLAVYRNLASFSEFRPVRWGVVLSQPERDAFALAHATARTAAIVGAGILVLALFAGAWVAGRLSQPLRKLAAETGIQGAGDEIAVLAERFRELARGLASAAEFLEDVVRALPVGVTSVDKDGIIRLMNPAQEKLSLQSGAVGRRHDDVFPGGEPPLDEGDRFYAGKPTRYTTQPLLRYRIRTSPLRGGGFVIVQEDLSERARLEQLSAVGVLAAAVAHEINNPMTTILGYAKLLEEVHPEISQLQLVVEEADRVQQIIRHLLDFSRQEPGPISPTDLNTAVGHTLKLIAPQLRKRSIEVRTELLASLPTIEADARRLEQVFVNLAQNAAQAMDGGGTLTVRTMVREGHVAVEFQDTGCGISADPIDRIFEPFFTTKGPGVGTGLGLAISREIVADHGGELQVESKPGQGATFRVVFKAG